MGSEKVLMETTTPAEGILPPSYRFEDCHSWGRPQHSGGDGRLVARWSGWLPALKVRVQKPPSRIMAIFLHGQGTSRVAGAGHIAVRDVRRDLRSAIAASAQARVPGPVRVAPARHYPGARMAVSMSRVCPRQNNASFWQRFCHRMTRMGRRPLLTKEKVLAALQRWTAKHARQPSVDDLRRELGVASTRTVFRYLQMLEDDRAIERRPGVPGVKVLKPLDDGIQTRAVPVIGRVPAGTPMLAEENVEGWIRVPAGMARPASDRFFLLSVRGTSMNKATVEGGTIDDGDLILVRQQQVAGSNDIVVAVVDGEATVKRLVAAPGYFILRPESKDKSHREIVVGRDLRIAGKVTHVLKKGSCLLRTVFDAADSD